MLIPVIRSVTHDFIELQPALAEVALYPVRFNVLNAWICKQLRLPMPSVRLTSASKSDGVCRLFGLHKGGA